MYRLHDLNGRELAALVHGDRVIEGTVSTANDLKELWASLKDKDILRRRKERMQVFQSYPENTDVFDEHLPNENDENIMYNVFSYM